MDLIKEMNKNKSFVWGMGHIEMFSLGEPL